MPGGLLNLVSYGNQNVILNGNPSKTFFKCAYAKYTNFGLQKFRIDFEGSRELRMTESSVFSFKVPRYGDLLMDTYLVVTLPTIWSTILPPVDCPPSNNMANDVWSPYEFKWIDNLGTQMMKKIRFIVGGQVIQEFTGEYLYNLVERDFDGTSKLLYYGMTGNIPELNDPAKAFGRNGKYPNVWPTTSPNYTSLGPEPSIHSRKLYIPINIWFTLASKMAFPLVSLQYNELEIEVELRPVQELFVIRDVENVTESTKSSGYKYNESNYIQPNFNNKLHQFYRFLQPPPTHDIKNLRNLDYYQNESTRWAADVHLISTYGFLSDDEVNVFASKPQQYLIKEVYQYSFNNVVGSKKINLESLGLISNWMWFFRRTDAFLRNQWANYTNWPYKTLPNNIVDPNDYLNAINEDETTEPTSFYKNIKVSEGDGELAEEFNIFIGDYIFKGYNENNMPFYYNKNDPEIIIFAHSVENNKKIWAFTKIELTFGDEHSYVLKLGETQITYILYDEDDNVEYELFIEENKDSALVFQYIAQSIPNPCDPTNNMVNINPSTNPYTTSGGGVVPSEALTNYKITGNFSPENRKNIMLTWGLVLDGKYRENVLDADIFNYVEKYTKSNGSSPDGLYCYNFCLHTSPYDFQPSGAINLSKFKNIEFEFTTYTPPLDPNAQTLTICDSEGNTIGINKPVWRIYDYTYDLIVMEERYNILTFTSGNAGLTYAR